MNEQERAGLSDMRDRWIAGGAAAEFAPPEWSRLVGSAPSGERERLLLAIAGQAFDVALRPAAPANLVRREPLAVLALPMLPDNLRPLFRAALKQAGDARARMRVVALAAARGVVAHPLDWMPSASDSDAPGAYATWLDWQADGRARASVGEALTVGNWEEFYPAARRAALADLRRTDPAAARALLEAKAAGEPAEVRLPLIELLHVNLGPDDAAYLQSLGEDRSGKVKQLAARLMARIGKGGDNEAAAELAEFIEQGKTGLIRRRTIFTPRALKSNAQIVRRAELFETCQLIDLARQFGVGEAEFLGVWQLGGGNGADRELAGMVAASGSDQSVALFAGALLEAGSIAALVQLLPRLDNKARRGFVMAALASGTRSLPLLYGVHEIDAGGLAGAFGRDELMGSALYKEMRAAIASAKPDARPITPDLGAFGFLASAPAAQAIAADLVNAGLGPADPSLALLRLNAALGAALGPMLEPART